MSSYFARTNSFAGDRAKVVPTFFSKFLTSIQIPGLTLRRTWLLSQLLYVACMLSTFFITTTTAATVMTALVGVPWACSLWAPFALISAEIADRDEKRRRRERSRLINGTGDIIDESSEEEDQAGIILGIHNCAVSAPQIIATMVSSAVFKALQKPRGVPYDESTGWCLRIGGLSVLVSAFITWRMKEPGQS